MQATLYHPSYQSLHHTGARRVIWAGFLATIAMTAAAYLAPMVHLPGMDFAAMLGAILKRSAAVPFDQGWIAGMLWHFANGAVIFPLVYSLVFYRYLPGRPWVKGLVFGWLLCLLFQSVLMPLTRQGFFCSHMPGRWPWVEASLAAHTIYGFIVGKISESKIQSQEFRNKTYPIDGNQA